MYTPQECTALREFYLNRNEVFLGPVDHDHVNQVILDLIKHAHTDAVSLVISSPGGETEEGFRLAQFIEQELQVPVHARVWGQCSSAATYALLCCKTRVAHPQATFVLHRQSTEIGLQYDLTYKQRVKEWRRDNANIHKQQVAFYTRKLKLSEEKVEKVLLRGMGIDSALSTKKALRIGLITEVSTF